MKTEAKTRDQVVDMLFSRKKTLRNDLNSYRVMQEQQPDVKFHKGNDLEILELISVKCTGTMAVFTDITGTHDLEQVRAYMNDLSISGETVLLLTLAGTDDALGPEYICGKADYTAQMEIDETFGNQRNVYLVGVFAPEFRHLYSPETMFQAANKARCAKAAERANKTRSRANEAHTGSRPAASSPEKPSRRLHVVPATSYIFTPDEKTGYREVI